MLLRALMPVKRTLVIAAIGAGMAPPMVTDAKITLQMLVVQVLIVIVGIHRHKLSTGCADPTAPAHRVPTKEATNKTGVTKRTMVESSHSQHVLRTPIACRRTTIGQNHRKHLGQYHPHSLLVSAVGVRNTRLFQTPLFSSQRTTSGKRLFQSP